MSSLCVLLFYKFKISNLVILCIIAKPFSIDTEQKRATISSGLPFYYLISHTSCLLIRLKIVIKRRI